MNRIDRTFNALKPAGKKALIPFITAGDPSLETTEELVLAMEQAGADIIELGVPFSDPVAEGPVIQRASMRSLEGGVTLVKIFELVKRLREKTEIPLILMMYINTIFRFGRERFFASCKECGIDGVIVPDLPFEEQDEIEETANAYGVHSIRIVAPTSKERIGMIAKGAKGFLYCVSSTGVTGVRNSFSTDFESFFAAIKKHSEIPFAVGFGISGKEQVKKFKAYCDGVIVGSAIVKIVEERKEAAKEPVYDFVKGLKEALAE